MIKDDEESLPNHDKQSIFIQLHNSVDGERIRNMNALDEDSCWSETSMREEQKNKTKLSVDKSIKEQLEKIKISMISNPIQSNNDLQYSKNSRKRTLQQIMPPSSKSRSNVQASIEQYSFNKNSVETTFFGQDWKMHQLLADQSIPAAESTYHGRYMTQISKFTPFSEFRERLASLTKIKIKMRNFYTNFTSIYRTRQLNRSVRQYMNDLSDVIAESSSSNKFSSILQPLCRLRVCQNIASMSLLDPQSMSVFIIKLFLGIANLFYFFFFSLFIVFQVANEFEKSFADAINFIWIVEIILTLNTQIYNPSIKTRIDIIWHYVRNKAFFDVVPLLIHASLNSTSSMKLFKQLIVFLKMRNFLLDVQYIQLQFCMRIRKYYLVQLFNLILKLFLIAHLISCLRYLLALVEIKYLGVEITWFDDSIGFDLVWWKLYLSALYWSLTLMTTGSNTSTTLLQTIFTIFIMLFTSISFAYILNIIGIILSEMDQKNENKRKDINIINEYMRTRKISNNLQGRVNINLQYFYENNFKQEQADNQQVLNKISGDLKDSLLIEYNKQILNRINLLSERLSSESLKELSIHLKEECYFPNQIIFHEKDTKQQSLMYILEGEVELFHHSNLEYKSHHPTEKLQQGDSFGHVSFFTGIAQEISAKSTKFTKIIKINRIDFINTIKKNDLEFEQFCEMKDRILNYNIYQDLNIKCKICHKTSHLMKHCPITYLNRDAILYKMRLLEKEYQHREDFSRKMLFQKNTLSSLAQIQTLAKQFKIEIQQEITNSYYKQFNMTSTYNSNTDSSSSEDISKYSSDHGQSEYQQEESINKELYAATKSSQMSFQKPDLQSQNRMKKNSFQNSRVVAQSLMEIEEQQQFQGLDHKKLVKLELGQDKGGIQSYEYIQLSSLREIKENSKLSNKDSDGQKNFKERQDSYFKEKSNNSAEDVIKEAIYQNNKNQQFIQNQKQKQKGYKKSSLLQSKLENAPLELQQQKLSLNEKNLSEYLKNYLEREKCLNNFPYNIPNKNIIYQEYHEYNPWLFDQLKDYENYFQQGNSKLVLFKLSRICKRKGRNKKTIKLDNFSKRN